MPLDPNISLNVGAPSAAANPLSTLGGYLDIQSKLNQNKLFQQTFEAKQRAGEIISAAPSPEEGMANLLKDPTVAPFAGQIINEYKQGQLFTEQLSGEKLKNNDSALQAVVKASMAGYHDPSQFAPALKSAMENLPPALQERVAPALKTWTASLMNGLPEDPAQAKAVYQQRLFAKLLANGVTPEVMSGLTGKTADVNTGGQDVFGVQMPAALGGGFQPAAGGPQLGSLGKTLAPGLQKLPQPDGSERTVLMGGGYGTPGGGAPGPGPSLGAPAAVGPNSVMPTLASPGIIPPAGGQVLGQTPDSAQATMLPEMGKHQAEYKAHLDEDVANGARLNKVIQFARQATEHFEPGGGADFKARIATGMQALGFDQAAVDKVANGSLAGQQEFTKDMNQAVFQIARESIPQGSRLAVAEFQGAATANPNTTMDPRAIEQTFGNFTKLYNQTIDEQKTYNDYRQGKGEFKSAGPGDLSRWPEVWQDISDKKGYVQTSPALHVGNPQDYSKPEQVVADIKSGKVTRDAGMKILQTKFGME